MPKATEKKQLQPKSLSAEGERDETPATTGDINKTPTSMDVVKQQAQPALLAGTDGALDGKLHYAVSVDVNASGKNSTLMIPDASKVNDGGSPVYITKRIEIEGENLKNFFQKKGVDLPDSVKNLVGDTSISCDAFYYTKNGPLLLMFALEFKKGMIESLTGDADLGELFDVKGASVRVLRCEEKEFPTLQKYVAELTADEPAE